MDCFLIKQISALKKLNIMIANLGSFKVVVNSNSMYAERNIS